MTTPLRRLLLPLVALALVASSCGTGNRSSYDVGLQRVALDLAFKDDELAKAPVGTNVPLPIFGDALLSAVRPTKPLPYVVHEVCPTAPKDAVAPDVAPAGIETEVKPGRYIYRDAGTFEVTGPIPIKGALPPISIRDYRDAKTVPQPNDVFGGPVPAYHSWAVVQPLGATDFIKREFNATATALQLTGITIHIGDAEAVFKPNPAITFMDLGTENDPGATWDSAGTDPVTGTSMIVRGGVDRREVVDACGTVYEAYKIHNTERLVSLGGGSPFSQMSADAEDVPYAPDPHSPNFYWVATEYGGQFLKEETHSTTTFGSTIITIEGTSTIATLHALALPKDRS